MKQREIIRYFEEIGGLRCKNWSIKEIKECVKSYFGKEQRVYESTCRELKRTAQKYQR